MRCSRAEARQGDHRWNVTRGVSNTRPKKSTRMGRPPENVAMRCTVYANRTILLTKECFSVAQPLRSFILTINRALALYLTIRRNNWHETTLAYPRTNPGS